MATGEAFFTSRWLKSRPASSGVRNVVKYPGVTKLKKATACLPVGAFGTSEEMPV